MRGMKLVGVLVGISAALLIAQPVQGAKPAAPSSITIDQSDVVYGDTVTFTTTIGPRLGRNTFAFIAVGCTQGSTPVFGESINITDTLTLIDGPLAVWDGGAASCTATLLARTATNTRVSYDTLASVTFTVAPA